MQVVLFLPVLTGNDARKRRVAEISAAALLLTEPIDEAAFRFYLACGFSRVGNSLPFLGIRLH